MSPPTTRRDCVRPNKAVSVGGPCLQEPDIGPGLVQLEPAASNGEIEASLLLGGSSLVLEQHRVVDQLNEDTAVLDGLDPRGDFQQLASSPSMNG
jgi:hypothetical protein